MMDSFTYMVKSLGESKACEVSDSESDLDPESKETKTRDTSKTTRYDVLMLPKVYGIRMSALTYKVMEGLVEGKSSNQVAKELGLNRNAVNLHKASVGRKLGIPSTEVVAYIIDWKKKNPNVVLPEVELSNSFLVAGVTLTHLRSRLLKELLTKDVAQIARETKMSKDSIMAHRYQICKAFGLPWEEVKQKVTEFWETKQA